MFINGKHKKKLDKRISIFENRIKILENLVSIIYVDLREKIKLNKKISKFKK